MGRDQIRGVMGHLTDRLGIKIDPNSKFIPWVVRHCTWLIHNMLPMKLFKGTTRWEIIKGRKKDPNIKVYEFLTPVVLVPQDRKKSKFKMKFYEEQNRGLYLGRVDSKDSSIIVLGNGMIVCNHTTRNIEMSTDEQKKILDVWENKTNITASE